MPGRPWTQAERDLLEWEWTRHDVAELARKLDRTPAAVREQARRLKLGSVKRGKLSMAEVERLTGYDRGRIMTAARRAGIHLPRCPRTRNTRTKGYKRRHYAIPWETMDRIVEELAKHPDGGRLWRTHAGEWGGHFRDGTTKPPACLDCGHADKPHHSRGRCRPCHDRRAGVTPQDAPRKIPPARWAGRSPAHCRACGRTDRPHRARGLCRTCYGRDWARSRGRNEADPVPENVVRQRVPERVPIAPLPDLDLRRSLDGLPHGKNQGADTSHGGADCALELVIVAEAGQVAATY